MNRTSQNSPPAADKPCCEAWEKVIVRASNTAKYVCHASLRWEWEGIVMIYGAKMRSDPVRFCPWCGAAKGEPSPLVVAAQAVVITCAACDGLAARLVHYPMWTTLVDAIANLSAELKKLKGGDS